MDLFGTLFSPFNSDIGTNAANQAALAQTQGINQGLSDLSNYFSQGRGALSSNFMSGLQPFLQNYATATKGTNALGNALGLGGPTGNVQAQQAFWNNPDIANQIQVGTQNVLRNAGAAGGGMSGATMKALQDVAQRTAAGGWQNYVSNLSPYLNYSQGSATGVGSLYSGLGSALNQSLMGQGNAFASGDAAAGAARANADLAAAQAQYGAGGNMWGALLGGGTMLGKMFSDIRLKDDVERVGTLNDGLPIYRYRMKGSPRTEIGVMAQDVERVNPEAVTEHPSGFKMVDYDRATKYSAGLERFLRAA